MHSELHINVCQVSLAHIFMREKYKATIIHLIKIQSSPKVPVCKMPARWIEPKKQ